MKIQTPAKINPLLYILGKREDGFHELFMHMIPVSLFDTLTFTPNKGQGLRFRMVGATFDETPPESPMPENNLVVRAVRAFEQYSGQIVHQDILLEKKIPSGAGLGGGSGNAAGTLQALNHFFRKPAMTEGLLSTQQLHTVAAELGADVPFFLEPSACEVRGRGERLKPLGSYPELPLVVVKPPFSIPTAEAYRECRPEARNTFSTGLSALCAGSVENLGNYLYNQFEISLLSRYPILAKLKTLLSENGAFGALVSGSGSAVFGLFYEKSLQKQAFQKLSCQEIGEVFACRILTSHCYF